MRLIATSPHCVFFFEWLVLSSELTESSVNCVKRGRICISFKIIILLLATVFLTMIMIVRRYSDDKLCPLCYTLAVAFKVYAQGIFLVFCKVILSESKSS